MEQESHELELQQELQRFASQFCERVGQAMERLERVPRWDVRDTALKRALLYVSSALEIATGAIPRINLLDMFVFVRLSRSVLDRHWVPSLFGEAGRELAEAFAWSDEAITALTEDTLGAARAHQLGELVDHWLEENPGQMRVEGVRLNDFAAHAGAAAADRALQARGLMSSVRTATRAANEAMLVVDRGMFVLHRLPFLLRLQVRLGAREIIGDIATRGRSIARSGRVFAAVLGGGALLFLLLRRRR